MSLKSILLGPTAFAAYIGAAAAIAAASLAYQAGGQYNLEHRKWMADLITRIAVNDTAVARGIVTYLNKSKILTKDDDDMLCRIFAAPCPEKR